MEKSISKIISYLFHPILLPTYGIIYILFLPTYLSLFPFAFKKGLVVIFSIMTFMAPLLALLILYNLNVIKHFNLNDRKERFIPFALTGSFYLATYIIFYLFPYRMPPVITSLILIAAINVFVALLFNFFFKISAHTLGIGGFTGFLSVLYVNFQVGQSTHLAILFLIGGLIAFARLKENSHTPFQVYAGYIIGIFVGLSGFLFF